MSCTFLLDSRTQNLKVIERRKIYCKYLKVDLIQEIQITLVKPYIGLLTSKMKISSANMENMSEK